MEMLPALAGPVLPAVTDDPLFRVTDSAAVTVIAPLGPAPELLLLIFVA